MASDNYWTRVNGAKDEILAFHRKITNQRDNLEALEAEDDSLHLALAFAIDQEELTAEETEKIREIWDEIDSFHK